MVSVLHTVCAWLAMLALACVAAVSHAADTGLPQHPHVPASAEPAADAQTAYTRLRQLAIDGDQPAALQGLTGLLEGELPAELRVRIYATAISITTNLEDWPQAFTLLNSALEHVPDAPVDAARLLGVASYLYTRVDDTERAIDLAQRALHLAQTHNNALQTCLATMSLAFAHESRESLSQALQWRRRQIQACTDSGDLMFSANGKYGLSKIMTLQGQHTQALEWAEQALADYQALGYDAGMQDARKIIAQNLVTLGQTPQRVHDLLEGLSAHYRSQGIIQGVADVEQIWATLAEQSGDMAASIAHLKEAAKYSREVERNMRNRQVAYLQIQFDTQSKEQQISLLETEKALAEATATAAHRWQLLLGMGLLGLLVAAVLLSELLRRAAHDRQRYRWEAEHDGLTGLITQQQLFKLGSDAFTDAMQRSAPITAVALDIDLFKQINDNHGHAAGDAALQSLGIWIRNVAGDHLAARRGGDEFTLLVQGDVTEAEAMLQRLRTQIAPITTHERSFDFTVSAGICQAEPHTASLAQLLHCADKALYRAKQQGRNRVVVWRGDEPDTPVNSSGSLVVVGSGIQFGRHASERTLSEIRQAQVVFCLADPYALAMITSLRPDTINLGTHYASGKDRRDTYREIDTAIMREVRAGKAVCAVFYGHPGVFADVPHRVIRKTRTEGLPARMEPGISAEACLYADLGLDPGQRGVQSLEATHFLYFDRQLDAQGLVLLWQVALAGDLSCSRFHAEREGLQALVTKLLRWYPPDHEVILYEAAQLPIDSFRAETLRLCDLPEARYEEFTTLVIPPLGELKRDLRFDPDSP